MDDNLLSISQAAEIIGVSIDTLRRWDDNGKLIAIRKDGGTHRFYKEEDLELFMSDLFRFAYEWVVRKTEFPGTFYCQSSAIFQARLVKMEKLLMEKPGYDKLFSLIVLVTGEIGDNSFAHNLGKWPDVSGIFFGYDLQKRVIVLADRGLGVLETLRRVRPELPDHLAAVEMAFTEFISGRAPEKRGNGLKLVREVVTAHPIDLLFMSGDAEARAQCPEKKFKITRGTREIRGCLVKINF